MAPGIANQDNVHDVKPKLGLQRSQIEQYARDGYLVLPSFLSPKEVASLLSESKQQLANFDLASHPMTRFSTGDSNDHVGDTYFLESGDKIRFFFEEDAFDKSSGKLLKSKERAINKFGHNLHGLSEPFKAVTLNERTRAVARDIGFRDARVLQSMVICKQPEIGGAVPAHQDSTFLYTDPPSAVGFWFALEDATIQNGCLSFAPGSHKKAPIKQRFVRADPTDAKKGVKFVPVDGTEHQWPRNHQGNESEVGDDEYRIEEVKAGDLVVIHGNVLHKSERNTSNKGRIIYTFHMIEGDEHFDDENWLQVPGGPNNFTRLYLDA